MISLKFHFTGICNIFSIIINAVLRRFICVICPIPIHLLPLAKLIPQISTAVGSGYIIGNFLLTLNRYTAIKYPLRHKKVGLLWLKKKFLISRKHRAVFIPLPFNVIFHYVFSNVSFKPLRLLFSVQRKRMTTLYRTMQHFPTLK